MSGTQTTQVYDCASGQTTARALTSAEQAALAAVQQDIATWTAAAQAAATAQAQDIGNRAALVQQATTAYQQLQSDITGWAGMTTAQKLDAVLRTMQALSLAMQAEKLIAQIMQRRGS